MKNSYYPGCTKHCKLLYSITPLLNDSPVALGSSGRKRERARVSPSRAPVFSCAHYFQAPAMQVTPLVFSRTFRGREAMTGNTSAVRRLKKYELTPKNACGGYLRTADVLPVVASLFFGGTEATTGNTSAVRRLVFLRRGKKYELP